MEMNLRDDVNIHVTSIIKVKFTALSNVTVGLLYAITIKIGDTSARDCTFQYFWECSLSWKWGKRNMQ